MPGSCSEIIPVESGAFMHSVLKSSPVLFLVQKSELETEPVLPTESTRPEPRPDQYKLVPVSAYAV